MDGIRDTPVVDIGGGESLSVLRAIVATLPSDTGAAFVIDAPAQAGDGGDLATAFAGHATMPIQIGRPEILLPNHVYLAVGTPQPIPESGQIDAHTARRLLSELRGLRETLLQGIVGSDAIQPPPPTGEGEQAIVAELVALNRDLRRSLRMLGHARDDLENVTAAAGLASLFLDNALLVRRFSVQAAELFNLSPDDAGRPIVEVARRVDGTAIAADAQAVLRSREPMERTIESRDGRWLIARLRPYMRVGGRIDGVVATFSDVTELHKAEQALTESQERLRQEMRLGNLSHCPIFVWDFDGGVTQWTRGSEELYGWMRDEILGRRKEDFLQTIVPDSSFDDLRQTLLDTGRWSGELLHHTKDGRVLTVEAQLELVQAGGRRLVLESTHDITDRKKWDERQRLLVSELTHRVRNTLTVVQSIARHTSRNAQSKSDFVTRFEGRLMALAEAHKLLIETDWSGAEFGMLARDQLRPYVSADPRRVFVLGPSVMLPPDLATPFGLVLHELATNASKYGALSVEGGRIELTWEVEETAEGRMMAILWREEGGPPVRRGQVKGVGSTLIERGLPGATVDHDFPSDGVRCRILLPLPEDVPQTGAPETR